MFGDRERERERERERKQKEMRENSWKIVGVKVVPGTKLTVGKLRVGFSFLFSLGLC